MSTAEYQDHSEIEPTNTEEQASAFAMFHEKAQKIHTAEMGEIERFKAIMDRLMSIESDVKAIKQHFSIVPIFGQLGDKG